MSAKSLIADHITDFDKRLACTNPWSLTAAECAILRITCAIGCIKAVANHLGLEYPVLQRYLQKARSKTGHKSLAFYLAFDRHQQKVAQQ